MRLTTYVIALLIGSITIFGYDGVRGQSFTHQDTIRGSITPERSWWDLTYYDLAIEVDAEQKSIKGTNTICFTVLESNNRLQVDLQEPLTITAVNWSGKALSYDRRGNAWYVAFPSQLQQGDKTCIEVSYEGQPIAAKNAPWDGGFSWYKDSQGYPFVATSCQGIGASVWWPCKDHMYDEPDSMLIRVTVPAPLTNVSNGRLRKIEYHNDGRKTWHWFVSNPINNYGVNANIARYAHWSDTLNGEKGVLSLDFYVLEENYDKARTHFEDAFRTIRAFEHWFGPYPFYEDGFKLVEVPYLGMEHQSSVTYGNKYQNGYLGRDMSNTGWGLKWDFIIVHEAAHEWWANNVTYRDIADMWIHEAFANHAEALFIDYHFGKEAATEYVIGLRRGILNDKPIIGQYGVNHRGSGDMYNKGGNMLHTLRSWIRDDILWRDILRGIQKEFYHQTVTTEQIEGYIARRAGLDLKAFFDQYLRDNRIPYLEYKLNGKTVQYRYTQTVPGFDMPLRVRINEEEVMIRPTEKWQTLKHSSAVRTLRLDPNFYVRSGLVD
jgi:aminopeptidase N